MTRNLEITLLRAFVTIADRGSMTAAAHTLHLTQGAISQRVAKLEAVSGPLFFRDHRDMRLTPLGERLVGHARRLLALHDGILAEMTAGIGIWTLDLATGMLKATPQFFRIMGLQPTTRPVPI